MERELHSYTEFKSSTLYVYQKDDYCEIRAGYVLNGRHGLFLEMKRIGDEVLTFTRLKKGKTFWLDEGRIEIAEEFSLKVEKEKELMEKLLEKVNECDDGYLSPAEAVLEDVIESSEKEKLGISCEVFARDGLEEYGFRFDDKGAYIFLRRSLLDVSLQIEGKGIEGTKRGLILLALNEAYNKDLSFLQAMNVIGRCVADSQIDVVHLSIGSDKKNDVYIFIDKGTCTYADWSAGPHRKMVEASEEVRESVIGLIKDVAEGNVSLEELRDMEGDIRHLLTGKTKQLRRR